MSESNSLSKIITEVAEGRRPEGDLFRAMLDQIMYAMVPISDDHPRVRLFMFERPDGQLFVPLFTDEEKAQASAQSVCRVIKATGRDLLTLTLGALVMINPNDEGCTLYPEECQSLLATGELGSFGQSTAGGVRGILAGPPQHPPAWLLDSLKELYATLPFVRDAYAVHIRYPNAPEKLTLTIVIVTAQGQAERAARASLASTYEECSLRGFAFDIATSDPDEKPHPLIEHGLRFYARDH